MAANGHRVIFRAELRTEGRSCHTIDPYAWFVVFAGVGQFLLVDWCAAGHVCPLNWARRMNPENEQFQPLMEKTEPGPQLVEKDNDNMNGSEKDNVVAKTTTAPTSLPTYADPCDCWWECMLKGKFPRAETLSASPSATTRSRA